MLFHYLWNSGRSLAMNTRSIEVQITLESTGDCSAVNTFSAFLLMSVIAETILIYQAKLISDKNVNPS